MRLEINTLKISSQERLSSSENIANATEVISLKE